MAFEKDYRKDRQVAGGFENLVLYNMCLDKPLHDDPYVTRGKLLVIGRVYAAAPGRGAGSSLDGQETDLLKLIAQKLSLSDIDQMLADIPFDCRLSEACIDNVVEVHTTLHEVVRQAICERSDKTISAANRNSFCSNIFTSIAQMLSQLWIGS